MTTEEAQVSSAWLGYALLTVATWGLYGVFLHKSAVGMEDPANGRYKAFLMVGLAYFITAILAPLAMLLFQGANWSFPGKGIGWGLTAGIVGAIGAFFVLMAFGVKGSSPAVVMSIIFAGAPIVNAVVATLLTQATPGTRGMNLPFVLGIALAAVGGCLVMWFNPAGRIAGPAPGGGAAMAVPAVPGPAEPLPTPNAPPVPTNPAPSQGRAQ